MRGEQGRQDARRGAGRAERERRTLREQRYAQRLEREGRLPPRPPSTPAAPTYEAEVVPGLEPFAREELRRLLGPKLPVRPGPQPGTLSFALRGDTGPLLELGTVAAVYRVQRFDIPRPRALLGEEHLQTLLALIRSVVSLHPADSFRTFRLGAAGATSAVFARLAEELQHRTGLRCDPEAGDLLLRVRRTGGELAKGAGQATAETDSPSALVTHHPSRTAGFEVLVRLTPRPLAARPWRVCNLPGALNATVARAMVALTTPGVRDRFVNLTCGSGTLMVERLALGPARLVLGGDQDPAALRCARENLRAAGYASRAALARWDAGRLPLADASVNALCADLPYGMLMGSRRANEHLYPALLAEAARVALPGATLVLITQAVRLLDQALLGLQAFWTPERRFEVQIPYQSGYLKPQVVLLRRSRLRSERR